MSYIGNIPGENFISFAKQNFTIVNSQTAYTLNFSVADENEISELSIGMSNDYKMALQFNPTYIRLGTILFGKRL